MSAPPPRQNGTPANAATSCAPRPPPISLAMRPVSTRAMACARAAKRRKPGSVGPKRKRDKRPKNGVSGVEANQKATAASRDEMRQLEYQSKRRSGLWLRRSRSLFFWRSLGLFSRLHFWGFFRSFLRLLLRLFLGCRLRLDRDELDVENESGIRANGRARGAAVAVSQIRGDKKLPLGADGHELNRFRPAFDDPADGNLQRLAALVGAVEFGIVHQRAAIVAEYSVIRRWLWAGAFLDDFVLQTTGESYDTLLGFVGGEKSFSGFLIFDRGSLRLGFFLGADFRLQCREGSLGFLVGEQEFVAGEGVFQAAEQHGRIDLDGIPLQVFADVHADVVADLLTRGLQSERHWSFRGGRRAGFCRRRLSGFGRSGGFRRCRRG